MHCVQSETFTPPNPDLAAEFNITYDPEAHGTDGPVYASYPRYFNPSISEYKHRATPLPNEYCH